MRNYIIKRLAFMVITLLVITMVSYVVMRLSPGDPTRAGLVGMEGQGLVQEDRKETQRETYFREKYHLDKFVLVGYAYWLKDVVARFDWGDSMVLDRGTPVMKVIAERMPATLKLNILAIILVYALAIPIGIYVALRNKKADERFITVVLFVLYSLPSFWVGLLLLMFFCGDFFLNIFPVAGIGPDMLRTRGMSYWQVLVETARYYVLPVICLTYGGLAGLSRFARVGILEVLRQDYVRTARAKGLPERKVILKHVFRNSLMPLITIFAGLLPGLVAGSVIIEYIFSIPGMGSLFLQALNSRDYPVIMALFTIGATLTLVGIMISDLLYAAVDPRITFE